MEQKKLNELERDVREYLSRHVYNGYKKPFELGRLEGADINVRPLDFQGESISLIPRGMGEEDISDDDFAWEVGLHEVGERFGVHLSLPYWLFRK